MVPVRSDPIVTGAMGASSVTGGSATVVLGTDATGGVTTTGATGGVGGNGATGGVGATGGEIPPDDSGGLTGSIGGVGAGIDAHIGARFQVQTHPWIPVSIVCVVPPGVVSPHVHVQLQFQTLGIDGGLTVGATGAGVTAAGGAASGGGGVAAAGAGVDGV